MTESPRLRVGRSREKLESDAKMLTELWQFLPPQSELKHRVDSYLQELAVTGAQRDSRGADVHPTNELATEADFAQAELVRFWVGLLAEAWVEANRPEDSEIRGASPAKDRATGLSFLLIPPPTG
jgi:hypothetical protein